MIHDWWVAHKFELIVELSVVALFLLGALVIACYFWFRARRRKS